MKKFGEIATIICALWGAILSSYIYFNEQAGKKPVLHTAIQILGKGEDPAPEGEAKDVRMKISVSNTGTESINLAAISNIQIVNSKGRWQRELTARLSDSSGTKNKDNKLPALLEPGKEVSFITPYYKFHDWFSTHNQYVVILSSEEKMFASYTPTPKDPDAVAKTFTVMNGIGAKHFSKYETPVSLATEITRSWYQV